MGPQVDVFQLILNDLKDIKENQTKLQDRISNQVGTIHKRIDEVVVARHQCELECKERDNQSKERDSDLKEKIWKTCGIVAGAINIIVEGIKWAISKLI